MKIALVGSGFMASTHAAGYATMPEDELVAVVDYSLERAEALALQYQAKAYDDFERMLSEVDPDVVDVCTPTAYHAQYAVAAANAGKHVISEKPMARTLEQAAQMIEAAEANGVQLFVGHVVRFFPEFAKAAELVRSGAIGEPAMIRTWRTSQFPTGKDDWFKDEKLSGGAPMDLLIHDFDWVRWVFGEVERVYAVRWSTLEPHAADIILVTLRFVSGAIAHLEGSFAHVAGFDCGYEITGTGGILDYTMSEAMPLATKVHAGPGELPGVIVPQSPTVESPYTLELKHFLACIRGEETPIITGRDGYEALVLAQAAIESARTGKPVVPGAQQGGDQ